MKNFKKNILFLMAVSIMFVLAGCGQDTKNVTETPQTEDRLCQVSTLNALMKGHYNGIISIDELKKNGDTGIGTFDTLDGEMIVLDGKVYKAKSDGTVEEVKGDIKTPFACVVPFQEDIKLDNVENIGSFDELTKYLNDKITSETGNPNIFYMIKIHGDFDKIHVRSVPGQEEPYKPLNEIASQQTEFENENIKGTIVALYCPDYVEGINFPGWHIHFLSDDHKVGGHVLGVNLKSGEGSMDSTSTYKLILPEDKSFADMKLKEDLSKQTSAVEGQK